ncbi:conglutin [Trifolium pratense]|uniref:Conglutin n=1 Tax=Trifolium pratense TaxID=57577 RepID=A0A2K3PM22_TRIPR|nr:conglutin [Trifolium pratense]
MARHNIILIASLLALVLFIAHTNASREKEMPESCRKQLDSLDLKHCEKHLMKRIQKDEDEDEDEDILKMRGINYIHRNREEDLKEMCCSQLSEINMLDCRCHALQEIMENLSDKVHKKEMDDMEMEVKKLPMRCGMAPPLGCDLSMDD